jgi:hypothetical protein
VQNIAVPARQFGMRNHGMELRKLGFQLLVHQQQCL